MTTYVEQAILDAAQGNIAYAVRCNITNNIVGTVRLDSILSIIKTNGHYLDIHGIALQ